MYNVGADLSETVSEEECHNILRTLDPNFTHKQTQGMLRLYDIDSSGMMTMGEILRYVQDIRKDVQQRIQEITHENPAMGLAPNPTKRYPLPFSGCLRIELSNPGIQKEHFRSMSSLDRSYVHSVAMQCEKFSSMVTHAVNGTKLRSNEAYALYESMIKDSGQKHETVCTLLPNIIGRHSSHLWAFFELQFSLRLFVFACSCVGVSVCRGCYRKYLPVCVCTVCAVCACVPYACVFNCICLCARAYVRRPRGCPSPHTPRGIRGSFIPQDAKSEIGLGVLSFAWLLRPPLLPRLVSGNIAAVLESAARSLQLPSRFHSPF